MHVDHGRGAVTARRLAEGAALREVVDTGADDAWIELDAGARWDDWYEQPYGWTTWEQSDGGRALSAAVRSGEALTEAQLALALCHRDGRIREAVLAGVADHPALLPLLVLRCADWAEPVRVSARRRLVESLDAGRAVGLLPLILRVARRQRRWRCVGGGVRTAVPRGAGSLLHTAAEPPAPLVRPLRDGCGDSWLVSHRRRSPPRSRCRSTIFMRWTARWRPTASVRRRCARSLAGFVDPSGRRPAPGHPYRRAPCAGSRRCPGGAAARQPAGTPGEGGARGRRTTDERLGRRFPLWGAP
ncbi:hypothetical protein [Streptomyces phaeoluteigriseus]|uniref:hypothetical protein n=1 Tax=Streptomyces phaeoluteigriseus TaxID=114686 RepID=UPI00367DD85A